MYYHNNIISLLYYLTCFKYAAVEFLCVLFVFFSLFTTEVRVGHVGVRYPYPCKCPSIYLFIYFRQMKRQKKKTNQQQQQQQQLKIAAGPSLPRSTLCYIFLSFTLWYRWASYFSTFIRFMECLEWIYLIFKVKMISVDLHSVCIPPCVSPRQHSL